MEFGQSLNNFSTRHYKIITLIILAATIILAAFIPKIKVDTDPENMLAEDQPVRVFHNKVKRDFTLYDMIVLGIVNEDDPNGVFNPLSLQRIFELTEYSRTLTWPDPEDPNQQKGVVEVDLLAPSTVDHIGQGGPGEVRFEWLMKEPPKTRSEAAQIKQKALANPLLVDTVVAKDGSTVCLFLPITRKDLSYRIYDDLNTRIPVIWLYAPLKNKIRNLDAEPQHKDTLTKIAHLAAFHAKNRQDFIDVINSVAQKIAKTDTSDVLTNVRQKLNDWKNSAQQLDENLRKDLKNLKDQNHLPQKIASLKYRRYKKQNYHFRDWLHQYSKEPNEIWLRVAALHVRSLENNKLTAQQLLNSTQDFIAGLKKNLPSKSNSLSKIADAVFAQHQKFPNEDTCHITGLPVAEDTFGYQMFIQMAVSAPTAMAVIFLLMLMFFRKLVLIISPMLIALVSVITTMGLLIGLGFPVHIMSSMIPIFLMPIAVVDSIHILSEFFDLYTKQKGRTSTIKEVMANLFTPMLYTSLTSAAGFASLALTPIPPVQVFGIFVAIGIMIAWLCTITFVPAYVMMIKEKWLENFGLASQHSQKHTWLTGILKNTGQFTYKMAKPILLVTALIIAISVYGITLININDNPIKWFAHDHPIRRADKLLNKHLGGTYMAYLVLEDNQEKNVTNKYIKDLRKRLHEQKTSIEENYPEAENIVGTVDKKLLQNATKNQTKTAFLDKIIDTINKNIDHTKGQNADAWFQILDFFEIEKERLKIFKRPDMLEYLDKLQKNLHEQLPALVGKTNSLTDIVKKVHQELIDGKPQNYIIPDSLPAVSQCLIQFQSSHTPDDLWHFVTYDYSKANIWFQLTSGDNKDMEKLVRNVNKFFNDNTPPATVTHKWAGLTYINVVWQEKMVWGMLQSFLASFLIVFIMMSILFRSPLWGIVCMVPLTTTIALIYGIIGLIGKDYDMPVAVLSALTLGMAVDFAIHFLQRARDSFTKTGSWKQSVTQMFGEPARAISRNVLVIAIGFLPLLAAPLIPYKTVGFFLCAIMALSGIATLLALPAIIRIIENALFAPVKSPASPTCNCALCLITAATAALIVAINHHQYLDMAWTTFALTAIIIISLAALACGIMSRRKACRIQRQQKQNERKT